MRGFLIPLCFAVSFKLIFLPRCPNFCMSAHIYNAAVGYIASKFSVYVKNLGEKGNMAIRFSKEQQT